MGAILVLLATHVALAKPPRDPVLPALALVPMLTLMGVAMRSSDLGPIAVYVFAGVPALLAAILVARAIGLTSTSLGLRRPEGLVLTAAAVVIGVPLGLIARNVVGLSPVPTEGPLVFIAVAVPFVVVLEELVFRGVLQHVGWLRSPAVAIVAPNILYASVYFGSGSGPVVLFMGLTGVIFSLAVARTGTLWGVLGAHLVLRVIVQL
jgi:membrane protease YdiL (CAAX protease family)